MTLNLNNILAFAAIFQSLFLSIFFFQNKKGNPLSNKILGTFLTVLAVTIFFSFTRYNSLGNTLIADRYPLFYITVEFNYLLGPLLYFYIMSLVDKNFRISAEYAVHFLPFIIITSLSVVQLISYEYFFFGLIPFFGKADMSLMIFHMTGYNIACIMLAVKKSRENGSVSDNLLVSWLRVLLPAVTLLMMIKAFIYIDVLILESDRLVIYSNIAYFIILFVFIYWISFYTLKKPEIFTFTKKYQKSELKISDLEEYKKRLVSFIEESKIYLDPSLTITMLSKKTSIPVPYLSRVINESFNLNFCDFINRYRIEESQQYLKDLPNSKKTILEIVYTVGFNSKSSFYEAFKKYTGSTPTEFIKSTV